MSPRTPPAGPPGRPPDAAAAPDDAADDALLDLSLLEDLAREYQRPAPRDLRALLAAAPLRGRLYRFAEQLGELMDVDLEAARALLDGLDQATAFEPGPFPDLDIALRHISGGPRVAQAITGFVRVGPGVTFPQHEHLGDEHVLVLQGYMHDEASGTDAGPGDVVTRPAGSAHAIRAIAGGTDLVYLAVVFSGVKIGDVVMGPGSPEL